MIFGVAFAFFRIQNAISKAMGKGGIRSKEDHELAGLDLPEMGVLAYPEFVGSHEPVTLHVPEEKGALVLRAPAMSDERCGGTHRSSRYRVDASGVGRFNVRRDHDARHPHRRDHHHSVVHVG